MLKINVDENLKYTILVQKIDIKKLVEFKIKAPDSIFYPFNSGEEKISEDNKYDFVEYDNPILIEFFLNQDWLLNYDTFRHFSHAELEIVKSSLSLEIEDLEDLMREVSEQLKESKEVFNVMINKKRYMIDSILYLERIKNGEISIKFPSVNGEKIKHL